MHFNKENTEPGIYHIHVDGKSISEKLYNRLISDFHFVNSDFSGSPEGYEAFYPERHLTLKLKGKDGFRWTWDNLLAIVSEEEFVGYLEGEFIPIDKKIEFKDYNNSVPFPFLVTRRRLSEEKGESFRETEFHLALDYDKSDKELIDKMLESGMLPAKVDKGERGHFIIFTLQGYPRDIKRLIKMLEEYLAEAGGAVSCTLKEEAVIDHELYGVTIDDLPEIVDTIS